MNGGIIGGKNRLTSPYRSGVWKPGDTELSWAGKPFPTSGLVHHWPLTSDGNDVVGSAHFTNYNTVTFSADGAQFTAASKNYLMVSLAWGYSFSWVSDFKLEAGGRFSMGLANYPNALKGLTLVINEASDDKLVFAAMEKTTSNQYSAITKNYRDSLWHHLVLTATGDIDNRRMVNLYIDNASPLLSVVVENAATISTSFAIGRRGAGVDASGAANWWGDGYVRNLRGYDRVLTLPEIIRVMAA